MKITPNELLSILNASMIEMVKHKNDYNRSLPKAKELYRWLISINWDEPYKEVILIDELPF